MRLFLTTLVLMSIVAFQGTDFHATSPQAAGVTVQAANVVGRWRVKFILSGVGEKNLVFEGRAEGRGLFFLKDTGPDDKPVPTPVPAVWSLTTSDRVNFSGDVELPLGTCCRETGTLVLRGKLKSSDSISGKAIFIASTEDEENFNGFRSTTGTFVATKVLD